jgi:RhoGAP domain
LLRAGLSRLELCSPKLSQPLAVDCPAGSPLQELPAANLNALWLLLELGNRVAAEAAINEMDARSLSAALAPVLAWHPPPPKTLEKASPWACRELSIMRVCGFSSAAGQGVGGGRPSLQSPVPKP